MTIYDMKNIVPLGTLDWGIYPAKNRKPIIYMYYRPNGDLMLYRTTDEIEVNLTTVSSYDNVILFRVDDEDNIDNLSITDFDARTIDVGKANYIYPFTKAKSKYIYILIPAIFNLHSIIMNGEIVTNNYDMTGVYEHDKKFYYVYRTSTSINVDFNIKLTTIINRITEEQANIFAQHISNYDDPHKTIQKILANNILSTIYWQENTDNPKVVNLDIIRGTTEELINIPIKDKQFLFDTIEHKFYVDSETDRVSYGNGNNSDVRFCVKSSKITRIEFVDSGYVPMENDNILWLEVVGYPTIIVNPRELSFSNVGGTELLDVRSNTKWTIPAAEYDISTGVYKLYWGAKQDNINVKPNVQAELNGSKYYVTGDATLEVSVNAFSGFTHIENVISFETLEGGVVSNIDIRQNGNVSPILSITPDRADISNDITTAIFNVTSNIPWIIQDSSYIDGGYRIPWGDDPTDYILLISDKSTLIGDVQLTVSSTKNNNMVRREKTVTINGNNGLKTITFIISQGPGIILDGIGAMMISSTDPEIPIFRVF